ncbi:MULTISPECIES: L-threonylcarbamoyladenylate synthase [unclassified Synechocystis]|uniref:L-threonylcarbamoyladenylate synthase n=1 Tax=unclassified Synechocystis TaxID=2640012 RepID=UPI00040353BD|nr:MULTISPECIES: L-threonylcarbamoyladenylate synthase [unclassified Synechocystis]AIE75912.1 TsaC protein (YrdC domain) required for threonylcarbamoyladenosine t(6)A37 modification in tRNA [Synechocystis sp. PCC 6714]MCT0255165.1 L-threonylcarbamoyladenylate synthase [Synechocystis sp. CS-94]
MPLVSQQDLVTAAIAAQVVSFPTDTVPALAVRPQNSALIYELKQREATKPLILMAATLEQIWPYLEGNERERKIWQGTMDIYWPGALTLVLPGSQDLPREINPRQDRTIGVRIPHEAIALEILHQTGPLATTSANLSGQPALEKLAEIAATFPSVYCLDCLDLEAEEPIGGGRPSTVAQWDTATERWQILRQGEVWLGEQLISGEEQD